MPPVPRVHDRIEIEREGDHYALYGPDGELCLRLDEGGRFLVRQLDGYTEESVVRDRFLAYFGVPLSDASWEGVIGALTRAELLNTNPRARRALTYLARQGLSYRSKEPDRRALIRGRERRAEDRTASIFERAVFLLNEGRLESALAMFEALARKEPDDLRIRSFVVHLDHLCAAEGQALERERRDPEWAAFDQVLAEMLERGECPRCGARIVVELGQTNHCDHCGASFSSYVLSRSRERRRVE